MRINDHCHSRCSPDGTTSMAGMARAAVAAGLDSLCFTDHCDVRSEQGLPAPDALDWDACRRDFAEAQAAVRGKLDLRLGVELGQPTQEPALARAMLQKPGIDFVIGSVHNPVDGKDYYYHKFENQQDCRAMLHDYFLQVLAVARSEFYDAIGHIGYPLRYMRYRDGVDVSLDGEEPLLREILQTVIARGRGIELNTSGYRTCGGEPLPSRRILALYRQLGGEVVTIGSDAHTPDRIAEGLDDGAELLRALGFRYLCRFRARTPEMIAL